MSFVLRCLCATFVLLVAIHCSQEFLIRYGNDVGAESSLDNGNWNEGVAEDKKIPHGDSINTDTFDAEAVSEEDEDVGEAAERRAAYIRMGRPSYMRIGKRSIAEKFMTPAISSQYALGNDKTFLRIGREPSDSTFLRIGRAASDKTFLRIGRATEQLKDRLLEAETEDTVSDADSEATNEQDMDKRSGSGLRIGKRRLRIGKRLLNSRPQNRAELTPEEIQLLLENKEMLLKLLELHPNLIEDDKEPWAHGNKEEEWAYFAFPRQGRAMSFYFPRMGRSGEEETNTGFCCDEGVRSVVTVGQNTLKVCPPEQGCCPGLKEKTKLYKDIIITECVAESGLEKIRAYIDGE